LAAVGGVLAGLPDAIDADRLEQVIVGVLVVCAIAAVFVLRTVRKAATRLLLLALLLAVGVGLWVQRDRLEDCRDQCTCHVFGQDVDMPDVPGLDCPS
jgi:hypothetical protein